jgi:hypothetical protein
MRPPRRRHHQLNGTTVRVPLCPIRSMRPSPGRFRTEPDVGSTCCGSLVPDTVASARAQCENEPSALVTLALHLAPGTEVVMPICDVCNEEASHESGTHFTKQEIFQLAGKGFAPEGAGRKALMAFARARGVSEQKAIQYWRLVTVLDSTDDWFLCPRCTARANAIKAKRWWQFWKSAQLARPPKSSKDILDEIEDSLRDRHR